MTGGKRGRGRWMAAWTLALGVVVLAAAALALRDQILDELAIRDLSSEETAVQERAALRLGNRRVARAAPKLVELFCLRAEAFEDEADPLETALASLGAPAVPCLVAALRDDDQETRWRISKLMPRVQAPPGVLAPALMEIVRLDVDEEIRCHAAESLLELGEPSRAILHDLLDELDRDVAGWLCTARAVDGIDPGNARLVAALSSLLRKAPSSLWVVAGDCLAKLGPEAGKSVAPLLDAISGRNGSADVAMLRILLDAGCEPETLLPTVLEFLRDEDLVKVSRGVEAAATLGPKAAEAVPLLIETLGRTNIDGSCQRAAMIALERIGPQAIEELIETLAHGELMERPCIVEALAEIGPPAKRAIPLMVNALSESRPRQDQMSLTMALGRFGSAEGSVIPALLEVLESHDDGVRAEAALAIARLRPGEETVVEALKRARQSESVLVRTYSAWALERIQPGSVGSRQELAEAMAAPTFIECILALEALEGLLEISTAILPDLIGLLGHDIPSVRLEAARAIGKMGAEARDAIPPLSRLIQTLDRERSPEGSAGAEDEEVRAACVQALEQIRGGSP